MDPHTKSERGQAIVFLALGFVVLLGFVALAIDGGMIYSNRRNVQNAADASSLSGGGAAALSLANSAAAEEPGSTQTEWDCTSSAVSNAMYAAQVSAINRAATNNFTIYPPTESNYVETVCDWVDYVSFQDAYIDVTVGISETIQASFAQLLTSGNLTNIVSATTRVRPMMPFVFGEAIVALREDCPNTNTGGIHFDGSGVITVSGGGLFSNACIVGSGTPDVNVEPPETTNTCTGVGCYTDNCGDCITQRPQEGNEFLPTYAYILDPPDCTDVPLYASHVGGGTIYPGRYPSIRLNNGTLNMEPGLYCVTDTDFRVNGGELNGDGVTIYIENGNYYSSGSAEINLSACMEEPCQNSAMYKVLFYLPASNTGTVSLLGGVNSDYTGLVYAPGGVVEVGGGGSLMGTIHVQIVADTVFIHGTTDIEIVYDDAMQLWKSSQIELYK